MSRFTLPSWISEISVLPPSWILFARSASMPFCWKKRAVPAVA
jgi:hypothetical protein